MGNHKNDLEERTYVFAIDIRAFLKKLPLDIFVKEDGRQLIRSSGSVAANYIEANEAFSKKDFLLRLKTCRKEAKESVLWLRLIDAKDHDVEKQKLQQEANELKYIFSSIITKSAQSDSK